MIRLPHSRIALLCVSTVVLASTVYVLTVDGPHCTRQRSPLGTCDLITERVSHGTRSYQQLWMGPPDDTNAAHWRQIGHRVTRGWLAEWCGPKHLVLTNLGEPESLDRHRIEQFAGVEILELHFGAMRTAVSPGGKYTLWTWHGYGGRTTAILSHAEDSIRLMSMPEPARVDGRWLDERRLQLDVLGKEGLVDLPPRWHDVVIEVL